MRTLCFAFRLLSKTNTFKSVAVLTLVSGFGANVITGRRLPENPPWQATAEEEKRGRELLSQVITAMGGGQKIDELTSYADVHRATAKLPQGDQEVGGRWIIEFVRGHAGVELPDRVREEVTVDGPQGKRLTVKVYGPGNSFVADQGRIHQLTEDRRLEWMMSLQQHPLMLLRARAQPRFRVAAAGNSQVDGRAVHLLLVEVYGRRLTLGIDAESRRILTVSLVTGSEGGRFERFNGAIELVEVDPEKSRVSVEIEMNSVVTQSRRLDEHLKTADFFEVARFPKASFVSTAIRSGAAGNYTHTVTGNLELRGVTKAITFPAIIRVEADAVTVESEFAINRKDFGIVYAGRTNDLIRDEVALKLTIKAPRPQPPQL